MFRRTIGIFAILMFLGRPAFADGWVVSKMRGSVFQDIAGKWVLLQRGAEIPNGARIQTSKNS